MPDSWLDELERLEKAATPGPWEFRNGPCHDGDFADLLMAEVGRADAGEDSEFAEVLFGGEFGDAQTSDNWTLIAALRNSAPRLIAIAKAAEVLTICVDDAEAHALGIGLEMRMLRAELEGK